MTNNYLKTKSGTFIFFNDRDAESRREAWKTAMRLEKEAEHVSIWAGRGTGRYPGEVGVDPHDIVDSSLEPISNRVTVIGIVPHLVRGNHGSATGLASAS